MKVLNQGGRSGWVDTLREGAVNSVLKQHYPLNVSFALSGNVHCLSSPEQRTLADALKSLKQGVSRRLIGDAEHFWQRRYYDFNVRSHEQFVEKLHYIHCNPVKSPNGPHANASEQPEGSVQPLNSPTQANTGLEWATRP